MSLGTLILDLEKHPVGRYAFGLDIVSDHTFEAAGACSGESPRGRTRIESVEAGSIDRAWPRASGHVLVDKPHRSGGRFLTIDRHPERGYRVASRNDGSYLISLDGRSVLAAVPRAAGWRWQRLLFAQVLPLASALQGFALFHASSVAIDGRGYGFVAASGTGKSSVAAHLVAAGASFLTDDVMALESSPGAVRIHPGAGMMAIDPDELLGEGVDRGASLGPVVGRLHKTYLALEPLRHPVPLSALYFLDRRSSETSFSISPSLSDPRLLLRSGFLTYLDEGRHLRTHLEVCAQIAERASVFRVRIPPSCPAREVAKKIRLHAGPPRIGFIG